MANVFVLSNVYDVTPDSYEFVCLTCTVSD